VIQGAEHLVEIHDPIEEVPRDVANQRLQEFIDRDGMRSAGPFDMRKIFIAAKREIAKAEIAVSKLIHRYVS
jgi:hypothetical protein